MWNALNRNGLAAGMDDIMPAVMNLNALHEAQPVGMSPSQAQLST